MELLVPLWNLPRILWSIPNCFTASNMFPKTMSIGEKVILLLQVTFYFSICQKPFITAQKIAEISKCIDFLVGKLKTHILSKRNVSREQQPSRWNEWWIDNVNWTQFLLNDILKSLPAKAFLQYNSSKTSKFSGGFAPWTPANAPSAPRRWGLPPPDPRHPSRSQTSHLSTSNLVLRELMKTKIEPLM